MTPPRFRRLLPACALVLALSGCGGNQNTLHAVSHPEHEITNVFWVVFGFSCFGFGVIVFLLFLGWWRREKPNLPRGGGERAATGVVLGMGIALPIALLAALFIWSDVFVTQATSAPAKGSTAMTIHVIGHQWWWEVRYDGTDVVTANEIHIPVKTRVDVELSTADVIHSFWIPELNRKTDMIPGVDNRQLLIANKPGVYRGQCSEFCGVQHAHMAVEVIAQTRAAYDAWLAHQEQPAAASSLPGAQIFQQQACSGCHQIRGTPAHGDVGPDLTHFASRSTIAALTVPNTPANLLQWIEHPQQVKPGNLMPDLALPSVDWTALERYLETLR
jgi:cytochrome c oxidase subunit 2